jgi:transposase-like protein
MTTMRKRHSAAFKAKLVQEMLREDKSLTQLAAEYGVHPNQLREWKRTALDGLPSLFEANKKAIAAEADHEQKVNELYAQIGRLTTQVAWLKKNYRCKSCSVQEEPSETDHRSSSLCK